MTKTISRIGLVAGDKNLPLSVVNFAQQKHIPVSVVGIAGSVSPDLKSYVPSSNYVELPITELSKTIKFFKSQNVDTVILTGGVSSSKIKFSIDCIKLFPSLFRLALSKQKYDGILRLVIHQFERSGLRVIGIQDFMPHLLITSGVLTKTCPTKANLTDAHFGYPAAIKFALSDKGQSIIVKNKTVIATERFSGTDALISRAANLPNSNGAILVKVLKPQQEIRADIPVLGVNTIQRLYDAGFSGVVIEAGKSIIDNREKVISLADTLGIFILGIDKTI